MFGNPLVPGPTMGCQFCVFFDDIHPSALAQGFITNAVIAEMNAFFDPGGTMPITPLSDVEIGQLAGVPEPTTSLLVGLALFLLAGRRRRIRPLRTIS